MTEPDRNINTANQNNFLIVLTDATNGTKISYFARTVTLPGWSMGGAPMEFRNAEFSMPSNTRNKDDLSIEFLLTEELGNLIYFREWGDLGRHGEGDITECLRDISLIFLDSNKEPFGKPWRYLNAFPTNISPLTLESGIVDTMPLTFTVNFMFNQEIWNDKQQSS